MLPTTKESTRNKNGICFKIVVEGSLKVSLDDQKFDRSLKLYQLRLSSGYDSDLEQIGKGLSQTCHESG